jgi:hypothetical protein
MQVKYKTRKRALVEPTPSKMDFADEFRHHLRSSDAQPNVTDDLAELRKGGACVAPRPRSLFELLREGVRHCVFLS